MNVCVAPTVIEGVDGLTVTLFTEGSVTDSVAVPDLPPALAVIVVIPAFTPVARPDELIVAVEVLLLDQVKLTF